MTHADDVFDALERRRLSADARPIPCFALDSLTLELPGWIEGGRTWLADADLGCFYGVRDAHVDIVARPGRRRPRLGLMRVVREILAEGRLADGGLLDVHAAAFAVGRRAVLLAGPKEASKTTLLCHALASGQATLIANDRVLVDTCQYPAPVHGVPTVVSVRPGTVDVFPRLRYDRAVHPVILHRDERESSGPHARGVVETCSSEARFDTYDMPAPAHACPAIAGPGS